jgi:cyclopropane fatty-acyl-phospholipid synthase-like methyltransferase
MKPAMDDRAGRFFHGFADTFDGLYDRKRGPLWRLLDNAFRRDIAERFRLTFEALGDLRGKTVLDVGCGSGVYLREALGRGAVRVVGIDPAPRMLALSKQRLDAAGFAGRYQLVEGFFPAVTPDVRPDAAIAMGVMDYVAEPVAFLRALREALGGGPAAISFPSWHWLRSPVRKVRYHLRNCPIWLYQRDQIERVVASAGMHVERLEKIRGAGQDFHLACR